MAVLNPLKQTDHSIMQDTDLAGPLVFCLAFGGSLMLVSYWICRIKIQNIWTQEKIAVIILKFEQCDLP